MTAPAWRSAAGRLRPDAVVCALCVAVVMDLWRVPEVLPQLAPFRVTILSLIVALGLFALDRHPQRKLDALATPVTTPLLIFAVLAIASIPFSLDPGFSAVYFGKEFLPRVLLALLAITCVRSLSDLEWLVAAIVAGACFYTLNAFIRIPVGDAGKWTALVDYDNNDYALIAISVIPMAIYFLRRDAGWIRRAGGALAVVLLVGGVVRSGSRGGMLGLLAVLAYLALRYRAVPARIRLGGALVAALALGVLARGRLANTFDTLLHPTQDYNWAGNAYNGRIELWQRGLQYMQDRPLTGVGLYAFPIAEGELSEVARERMQHGLEVKQLVAHDMYIQVGAELGIPALIVFLVLLVRTQRSLSRVRTRASLDWAPDPERDAETAMARVLSASLLGFCVSAVFIAAAYFTQLIVLFGLVGALAKISVRHPVYAPEPEFDDGWSPEWNCLTGGVSSV